MKKDERVDVADLKQIIMEAARIGAMQGVRLAGIKTNGMISQARAYDTYTKRAIDKLVEIGAITANKKVAKHYACIQYSVMEIEAAIFAMHIDNDFLNKINKEPAPSCSELHKQAKELKNAKTIEGFKNLSRVYSCSERTAKKMAGGILAKACTKKGRVVVINMEIARLLKTIPKI